MNNNSEYPLFTVIIPQKNRAEYIEYTLRTCMIQDYPNLEFIVADDCSEDDSVNVIKKMMAQDARIKLIAHEKHVGMRDNFEIALSYVRPGYVMALGGDDGLVPGCFWEMYKVIQDTGAELLTWPTHVFKYADDTSESRLTIIKKKFNGVKMIKSKDYLTKISRTFKYMTDDCPMFYIKGVASTALVEKVKSRTRDHCFYYCPTPDGFSGVVLAGEVKEYAYLSTPLSISGNSPKSQGLNYKRTDERSKKESQQFFNDNIRRTMHKDLASQQYSPLITLMTADYLLTARDLPGWPGEFPDFRFEDLIRATFAMLIRNPFANEVLVRELTIIKEIAKQHNLLPVYETLLKTTKRKLVMKDSFDAFRLTRNTFQFSGTDLRITNIFEASQACTFAYYFTNSISFKWLYRWIRSTICAIINKYNYKTSYLPEV